MTANVPGMADASPAGRSPLQETLIKYRLPLLVIGHLIIFTVVYCCAFGMRFTFSIPEKYAQLMIAGLPVVVLIKLATFYFLRMFHGWWRHVTFSDFISLTRTAFVASLLVVAVDYFVLNGQIPRTVILNDFLLTIFVIGSLRSACRVWDERIAPLDHRRVTERALLLGNNFDSAKMAHLINGQPSMGIRVVGLVTPTKVHNGRHGFSDLRVVGNLGSLAVAMRDQRAKTLFVIAGSVPGKQLRGLLDAASGDGFKIKIIPKLQEQLRGVDRLPIREVAYNDLLRRPPVILDLGSIAKIVQNKTILVTGAGGSIGSELCRQLSRFSPARIILLGRGENRIYQIEREFSESESTIQYIPRVANITDQARMQEVFWEFRPELVFHAAAHKHVPLVEQNVGESIINNVLGTKVVADLASQFEVERFVLVSTDKSVNPTSIMGCTKQMAERYCQSLGEHSSTMFISTRFGNVLGSAGSVVPLFQEQIRKGGPITITDERMTRFFMTIPEASQLVIQSAAMGKGGEIFVLEMGEPVKILDLAKDLIRLAGHPPGSIDIVAKGIRPGEKLFEELYYASETSLPTKHDQILSSYSRVFSMEEVEAQVETLIDSAYDPADEIREKLKLMIPEFMPQSNSVSESIQ